MKLAKLVGYLPNTANTAEHARALQLKELLDALASDENTSLKLYEVTSGGTVVFGLANDQVLEKVAAQFREEKDVVVSETTMVSFQREQNRLAQMKVDRMREKKAKKTE